MFLRLDGPEFYWLIRELRRKPNGKNLGLVRPLLLPQWLALARRQVGFQGNAKEFHTPIPEAIYQTALIGLDWMTEAGIVDLIWQKRLVILLGIWIVKAVRRPSSAASGLRDSTFFTVLAALCATSRVCFLPISSNGLVTIKVGRGIGGFGAHLT